MAANSLALVAVTYVSCYGDSHAYNMVCYICLLSLDSQSCLCRSTRQVHGAPSLL